MHSTRYATVSVSPGCGTNNDVNFTEFEEGSYIHTIAPVPVSTSGTLMPLSFTVNAGIWLMSGKLLKKTLEDEERAG